MKYVLKLLCMQHINYFYTFVYNYILKNNSSCRIHLKKSFEIVFITMELQEHFIDKNNLNESLPMSLNISEIVHPGTGLFTKCERPPKYFKCVDGIRSIEEIRILFK